MARYEDLNLSAGAFDGLRMDFEDVLNDLVTKMYTLDYPEATMRLDVQIMLESVEYLDPATGALCKDKTPVITHKLAGELPYKNKCSNTVVDKSMVLSRNSAAGNYWSLKKISENQQSFFDEEAEA